MPQFSCGTFACAVIIAAVRTVVNLNASTPAKYSLFKREAATDLKSAAAFQGIRLESSLQAGKLHVFKVHARATIAR